MYKRFATGFYAVLGLLFLALGPVHAEWITLDGSRPAAPTVAATDPGPETVVVEFEVSGFESDTVDIEGQPYSKIVLPDHVQLLRKGLPQLPLISRSVIIPDLGTPRIRIVASDYRDMPAAPPEPSKGDLPRTIDPETVPYTFDPVYTGDSVWPPETAALSEPFILRDYRGVTIHVYPFRYDFGRGVLQVLRSLTVEVATSGEGGINPKLASARLGADPQFHKIYDRFFLNRAAEKYSSIARPGPMLVICHDSFMSYMVPFVEWKQQRGFPVEMIPISAAGGTATGVQTAITTRYNSAAGLTYVILVGDLAQIPSNIGAIQSADSDPMYTLVEGSDFYADLFISRISGSTPDQIQIQVAKFIRYEKNPDTGAAADWFAKGMGIASNESGGTGLYDYERADLLRDDLLGYTFTEVDQIYQGMGGSTAGITSGLNDGRSIVNYIGHGSGTSWSSVSFSNSDVHALSNAWMQPWIVDVSCSNGDFSNGECFAEAWMRAGSVAQPKGAVGIFSASATASWVPPVVMQAEVIDLLVADTENQLGSLYFSGAMKTLDDYPLPGTEGQKLVEQYNIFGDCSLEVRTTNPATLAVTHASAVPLGSTSFGVDVAGVPGATVCLWRDGVIHGTAVTDAGGHADVTIDPAIATVGDVTLTVTAYNHVPYITTVPAIVPAVVIIDPMAIDANKAVAVTVMVYEEDGITPKQDIDVWAEGLDYSIAPVATDKDGVAVLSLHVPYGPTLDIVGKDPVETYRLFTEPITVTASSLTSPDLTVTTDIGLSDSFALNLPGTLHATVGEPGATLYAELPDGTVLSTTDASLMLTPAELGDVIAFIGVPGYDAYSETFPIIEAYGTLTGTVASGGTPLAGVTVQGYDDAMELVFEAVTNGTGAYDVGSDILVAEYTISVSEFGYLLYSDLTFVNYGANVYDVELVPAPSGVLSGTVTEFGTGLPLQASVKIYRSDTQELYSETTSDPGDGTYATSSLPYFDYRVSVSAAQHIPVTINVTIDDVAVTRDFVLEETIGNILMIDEGSRESVVAPPKRDKDLTILEPAYLTAPDRAAQDMVDDMVILGYTVTQETSSASNPATWPNYDLVVVSAGASTSPVAASSFRDALESYCLGGGHLLIEGGEIGYVAGGWPGYPTFMANVLHIADWEGDSSGSVTVADPTHFVMSVPNTITGPITVSYNGYGDQDRVTIAGDAEMPGAWTSYATLGSVVAHDDNPSPEGGQIVFFTFNYSSMDAGARASLLQNAVNWLLAVESGNASVSGSVTLQNMSDHSGVQVVALPGGASMTTGPDGEYTLSGLFAGDYQIIASKDNWTTGIADVTLANGEQLTGVDFTLMPVQTIELCQQPAMPIPDNSAVGVNDTLMVSLGGGSVTAVEVFLDLTHTYIGDVIVELTSPDGTSVLLHNRTGSSSDNIYGWYPGDLTPAQTLDAFVGDATDGGWILHVSDNAGSDTGTLNEWCLRITYPDDMSGIAADGDAVPAVTALLGNYPNPFNPRTQIVFSLPQASDVVLAIYDVQGRHVTTLVGERLPSGRHEIVWSGLDATGHQVSSGLYFYRLRAGDFSDTGKMMLMK